MEITKPNLSFDLWRAKIIKVFYIIVALIFVVEVIIFIAFRNHGLLDDFLTKPRYIANYIAIPT